MPPINPSHRAELEEKILENLPLSLQESEMVASDSGLSALRKEMEMLHHNLVQDPRTQQLAQLSEEDWARWQQGMNKRIDAGEGKGVLLRPAVWGRKLMLTLGPVAAAAAVFFVVKTQTAEPQKKPVPNQVVSQVKETPKEASLEMDFFTDEEALALAEVFVENSAPRSGSRG